MNHATTIPAADDRDTFDSEAADRAADASDAFHDQAATIIADSPTGTDGRKDGDESPTDRGDTIIPIISE